MTVTTELYAFAAQTQLSDAIDIVADNIANADTPGYKREELRFSEYLQKLGTTEELSGPDRRRDFSDGPLTRTGNALDVAIRGEAFFSVETPEGVMYTRNGHFTIDQDGNLATSTGLKILGNDGGPIVFAPTDTDITIGSDGKILAQGAEIGTLDLVSFANTGSLERAGNSLFIARGEQPEAAKDATIAQGMIEDSNVRPVVEITRMMKVMRGFSAAQKMLDEEDERIRQALQVLTQVS